MTEVPKISCRLCLEENCKDLFHDLSLDEENNRSNKALMEIFRVNVSISYHFSHQILIYLPLDQ